MHQPLNQILVSWEDPWDSERAREENLKILETELFLVPMTFQEQKEESDQRKPGQGIVIQWEEVQEEQGERDPDRQGERDPDMSGEGVWEESVREE